MAAAAAQAPGVDEGSIKQAPVAGEGPASPADAPSGVRPRASTPPPRKQGVAAQNPTATAPPAAAAGAAKIDAATVRAKFIRKVYGILFTQLALTALVSGVCAYSTSLRGLLLRTGAGGWMGMLVFLPTVACLTGLKWKKNSYPTNYYLLFGLTLLIALDVGFVTSILSNAGLGLVVVQAAALTALMFVGLTAYVFHSGRDFSFMKGFLSTSLWGLVICGLFSVCLGTTLFDAAVAWLGAATFCGYILYDTDRLATKLGCDDYILATVELYLDIVNLFLHILKVLLQKEGRKGKKRD